MCVREKDEEAGYERGGDGGTSSDSRKKKKRKRERGNSQPQTHHYVGASFVFPSPFVRTKGNAVQGAVFISSHCRGLL